MCNHNSHWQNKKKTKLIFYLYVSYMRLFFALCSPQNAPKTRQHLAQIFSPTTQQLQWNQLQLQQLQLSGMLTCLFFVILVFCFSFCFAIDEIFVWFLLYVTFCFCTILCVSFDLFLYDFSETFWQKIRLFLSIFIFF